MDAGPPVNPIAGIDEGDVELVSDQSDSGTTYRFIEGPQWIADRGVLLFSDIEGDTIYRLTPSSGSVMPFRNPSRNANGLALDVNGDLLAAEHGGRRVTRTPDFDAPNETTIVASEYNDQFLNSPNDIAVRSDGQIYFTDPPYGLGDRPRGVPFNGVYRVTTDGAVSAEFRGGAQARPNGIAFSPDERVLYVADSELDFVMVFDVASSGALSNQRTFAMTQDGGDGIAIDRAGNVFVATNIGVQVFKPDGERWGIIEVPMVPSNCAFGGADARTLYITARHALYRVQLAQPGIY